MIFVGDDWAEAHHDVCLMTETGETVGYWKLDEGIEGLHRRCAPLLSPLNLNQRSRWDRSVVVRAFTRVPSDTGLHLCMHRGPKQSVPLSRGTRKRPTFSRGINPPHSQGALVTFTRLKPGHSMSSGR